MKLVCYRIDETAQWKAFQSKMDILVNRMAEQAKCEPKHIWNQLDDMLSTPERAVVALVVDIDATKLYGYVAFALEEWRGERAVHIHWISMARDLGGKEYLPCVFNFVNQYGWKWGCRYRTFKLTRLDLVMQKNDRVTRKLKHFDMKADLTYWGEMPQGGDD